MLHDYRPLRFLALFLFACGLAPAWGQQCVKPGIPSGGLAVTMSPAQTIVYSDGYTTRGELNYPTGSVPSCGWPLVVYVHGFSGSRGGVRAFARDLAARGFAVWSFDVRGQGDGRFLNPATEGFSFQGPAEKYDLAEQILFARNQFPALVNSSRTAVTGTSQGAITSWYAAAYSERTLSVPGRGTLFFPRIDAVAPHATIADVHEAQLPGGTTFLSQFATHFFTDPPSFQKDASIVPLWKPFFLNEDPVGLYSLWQAQADRLWGADLANTAVPVLYQQAYHDATSPPLLGVERFAQLPASTPKRIVLSTGGHSSPLNQYEFDFRTELRVRWFDRFLWDLSNGVDLEEPIVRAAMPLQLAQLNDIDHPWGHRQDAQFAALDLVPARLYLTAGGLLDGVEPTSLTGTTTINHQVATGYTPAAWGSAPQMRSLATVLSQIPLSERTFELPALTAARELCGRIPVHLSVIPSAATFQLNLKLSARIPGATADFAICSMTRGILDGQPGVPMAFDMDLPTAACVLPAGTVLKLTVRNHWTYDQPMPSAASTITVPYFQSSLTEILHGGGAQASYVDFPYRSQVRFALTSDVHSATDPLGMTFNLEGGAARGNSPFFLLMSFSGQAPGTPLGGLILPLNFDALTLGGPRRMNGPNPVRRAIHGTLDAQGRGVASFGWLGLAPLSVHLAGQRLSFAAWTMDSSGAIAVSNPLDLILR